MGLVQSCQDGRCRIEGPICCCPNPQGKRLRALKSLHIPMEEPLDHTSRPVDYLADLVLRHVVRRRNDDMVATMAIHGAGAWIEADVERLLHCCAKSVSRYSDQKSWITHPIHVFPLQCHPKAQTA